VGLALGILEDINKSMITNYDFSTHTSQKKKAGLLESKRG
jgi:hypothetical protein